MEQIEARFKQLDVLPMVKHYMDALDLYGLFKMHVPSSTDCLIEYAESLCLLTANIICDNKPLYKVSEWLSKYSDGLVNESLKADLFNDDRFARALSALFKADRHSLMTQLSCNAMRVHQLHTDEIHNDSTSITFKGLYENDEPGAVKLKHGHNKDFRPDCKQLVFGLNITADGHVPLSFSLFDGNTNDDITHIPNWNGLRSLLDREDFIYVADCKLCSEKNLTHIAENHGFFITIVPRDRNYLKPFINYLKSNPVQWAEAFEVADSRKKNKAVKYKTYESGKTREGFRILWVHSSSKEQEDMKRRQKKIEKTQAALEELSQKLNRCRLKTQKQIKIAVDKVCRDTNSFVKCKIVVDRKQIKVKVSPGRPGLNTVYKNKWSFTYSIEWELDKQAIAEASKSNGIFPLITNTDLQAAEVLRKYKKQPYLEKRMYTKKTVLEVAPVFVKKQTRIEALLFLYFVALMLVSLIERKIRMNMARENIEKLPILPQGMNSKKPTWNNIRYFYRNIHLAEIVQAKVQIQSSVKGLTALHKQVNQLLEVSVSVYAGFQEDWWQFKDT